MTVWTHGVVLYSSYLEVKTKKDGVFTHCLNFVWKKPSDSFNILINGINLILINDLTIGTNGFF